MIELKFTSTSTKNAEEQSREIREQSIAWAGHLLQFGIMPTANGLAGNGKAAPQQAATPDAENAARRAEYAAKITAEQAAKESQKTEMAVVKTQGFHEQYGKSVVAQAQETQEGINAAIAQPVKPKGGRPKSAAAAAVAHIEAKAAATVAPVQEVLQGPTYEDVKAAFQKVFEAKDIDFAIALLKEWNAVDPKSPSKPPNTKNLKPEQYAEFISACEEATT